MSVKLSGTRAEKKDVGRYSKVDTGTALAPIKKDSTIDGTRASRTPICLTGCQWDRRLRKSHRA